MRLKKVLAVLMIAVLALLVPSCGAADKEAAYSYSVTDAEGVETTLDKLPARVVSISPAITETFAAVAGLDALVGRTSYCDYPAEVSAIDDIGTLYEPNIEKIISLDPDVVLLSAHTDPAVSQALRDAGLKVVRIYGEDDFDGAYGMVETIGDVMGVREKADGLVADMKAKVAAVEAKVKDLPKKTVYYVVDAGEWGDYTATGDTYVSAMLERAGGDNIAKDASGWAFSLELIIERDPAVLITSQMSGLKAMLPDMNGYKDLTAVKEGNVAELDTNPIDRIGIRFADGFEALARAIHPEAFQ